MRYQIKIPERVKQDIRRNANWWSEHHSTEQAQAWLDAAFAKFETLDRFPESHPLAYESDEFSFEIRKLHFGAGSRPSYRAVFTSQGTFLVPECMWPRIINSVSSVVSLHAVQRAARPTRRANHYRSFQSASIPSGCGTTCAGVWRIGGFGFG